MLLRDVNGWPPSLLDSQSFKVVASNDLPATLKRCGIYSIAGTQTPYLSIVVSYDGRSWHASLQELPEELMKRIESTLKGHEGEKLASLGDLEIIES